MTLQQCSLEYKGGREHHGMCRRKEKEAMSLTEPGTQLQGSCCLHSQLLNYRHSSWLGAELFTE